MKRTSILRRSDGSARLTVKLKLKKCRICETVFGVPKGSTQIVCDYECAHVMARKVNAKKAAKLQAEERRATRAGLEKRKSLPTLVKEAQAAFNKYVRLRDIKAGHGCIDCGKPFEPQKPGGSIDAGHYLSRGSNPQLKFDERNVFAQRKNCNRPGGATRADFRDGVIARIGLAAVEALEAEQTPKHYSKDDVREIKRTYAAKARELEKGAPDGLGA